MSEIQVTEITDKAEQKRMLMATSIDIMMAGSDMGDRDGVGFFAAHNNRGSVFALKLPDDLCIWTAEGGSKEERKALAETIRQTLRTHQDLREV